MTLRALFDVPAPAKLNLFLHVVGRRADGYHLIQSLFVFVDWADRLHFERRDDGGLARHDVNPRADVVLPADDLCLCAARALKAASGSALGVDIHLDKQLPAGAGMGGGSSDAATTLLALNRLWGLNWPRARLAAIGLTLGADVPFFIGGANAFVEGIGERLTPVDVPQAWYAVVKPPVSIETAAIFGHPQLKRDTERISVPVSGLVSEPAILAGSFEVGGSGAAGDLGSRWVDWHAGFGTNDLQPIAQQRCPEVAEAARWLATRFGNSRMTGSGSAVFARVREVRFEDMQPGTAAPVNQHQAMPAPAAAAAPEFPAGLPAGWVGRMCKGLVRHPLVHWTG